MRELCRLQTFPDDVVVRGTYRAIHRQVGNAVPSLLAEVLAREIRSQLLGLSVLAKSPTLMPPNRSPAPAAEPVRAVPRAFAHLIGEHDAHPGTGRGYRAAQRPTFKEA
jgi:DNA (cytosine-5)-methyltransferase 1